MTEFQILDRVNHSTHGPATVIRRHDFGSSGKAHAYTIVPDGANGYSVRDGVLVLPEHLAPLEQEGGL